MPNDSSRVVEIPATGFFKQVLHGQTYFMPLNTLSVAPGDLLLFKEQAEDGSFTGREILATATERLGPYGQRNTAIAFDVLKSPLTPVYDPFVWHEEEEPPALPIELIGLDSDPLADGKQNKYSSLADRCEAIYETLVQVLDEQKAWLMTSGACLYFFIEDGQLEDGRQIGRRSALLSREKLVALDDPALVRVLRALFEDRQFYVSGGTAPADHLFAGGPDA